MSPFSCQTAAATPSGAGMMSTPVCRKMRSRPAALALYKAASARVSSDCGLSPSNTGATPPEIVTSNSEEIFTRHAIGERAGPLGVGVRHDHDEFLAAVAGHDVGVANRLVDHPGHVLQGPIALQVSLGVVDLLEMVDIQQHHHEVLLVAVEQGEHRLQRLVERPAIAHPSQGIGANFGERHQVVRLLADFVVSMGDLGRQAEGRLEHVLGFLAQLLPGGLLVLAAQITDPILEVIDAGMVRGQIATHRFGDRFQFGGDGLGPLQLASSLVGLELRLSPRATTDEVADDRDQGKGDRSRNGEHGQIHTLFSPSATSTTISPSRPAERRLPLSATTLHPPHCNFEASPRQR